MSMTMNGEVQLPAPRAVVWEKLNDPKVLAACIPGCESLEQDLPTEMRAAVKVKVGPVSARFKGRVELQNIVPEVSYRIQGEGEGGIAGFAKGGADVRLEDGDFGSTKLFYDVQATVGGKIAQLGGRLINSVAKKNADDFFQNFTAVITGDKIVG